MEVNFSPSILFAFWNNLDLYTYYLYVGKHLTPRGGVILKGLVEFRGGTQRVGLSKGGGIRIFDQF